MTGAIVLDDMDIGYARQPVIRSARLRIELGQATAVIGPNGAGKSTLLKTICGVIDPLRGTVGFESCGIGQVAYLPQRADIDRAIPVSTLDLVMLGSWKHSSAFGGASAQAAAASRAALARVGLEEEASRPIRALSIGQFQRALFARLIVQDQPIILLDEPFAAIDAATTLVLLNLIGEWEREGRTIVAALHDLHQVRSYFSRAILIDRRIIAAGSAEDVLQRHAIHGCSEINDDCDHGHHSC